MNFRDAKIVLTEDVSSGRVHERLYRNGGLRSSEGCNLDDAGHFRVIDSIDGIAPDKLCRRCFPEHDEVPA